MTAAKVHDRQFLYHLGLPATGISLAILEAYGHILLLNHVLVGQLKYDMRSILLNIASNSDPETEVMERNINHIHFLVRYMSRLSVSQIVRRLKQESTRQLWLLHHTTLRQYYWYCNILWSDGFFVCAIAEASP